MVIFRNKVFLHIPKTGGSFFRETCRDFNREIDYKAFWSMDNLDDRLHDKGHANINNFHLFYDKDVDETHTMLRDPISRFHSIYKNFRLHKNAGNLRRYKDARFLEDKLGSLDEFADYLLDNPHVIHHRAAIWSAPQYLYCGEDTKKHIYESEDSWRSLFQSFGIKNENVKIRIKKYETSNELKEKIQNIYKRDCEIYGRSTQNIG